MRSVATLDVQVFDREEVDNESRRSAPARSPPGCRPGAWLKRWGLGLAGWGIFVLVVYLTAGERLNGYLGVAGL